jgi:hypothetical protein
VSPGKIVNGWLRVAGDGEIPPIEHDDDFDPLPLCGMNDRRVARLAAEL